MITAVALAWLETLRPNADDLSCEAGVRDGAAFVRVWRRSESDRWAVVRTPGDRWFAVEIDGGYSLDHFEEDASDDDVRELLRRYVDIGLAYVRGDSIPRKTARFRSAVVTISTAQGEVELSLALLPGIKSALKPLR